MYNETLDAVVGYQLNEGSELCGAGCSTNCCVQTDLAQLPEVVSLMKCDFALVPAVCLFLSVVSLLFYPVAGRTPDVSSTYVLSIDATGRASLHEIACSPLRSSRCRRRRRRTGAS